MTKRTSFLTFSVILITVLGIFFSACKKDEDTAPLAATSIALESGGDQTAQIEMALTNSVVVIVNDQDGKAFKGATVKFAVTEGSVSAATGTTDAEGKATVNWTLGATVGTQTLTVTGFKADGTTALSGSPISVTATGSAVPLVATSLELVSGNSQTATVETALTNPVVVIVKDQNGDAFAGTEVSFAVTEGSVSNAAVTTDASGSASVTWTLGATVGEQVLTATVTDLTGSPVEFRATAEEPLVATSIELVSGNNQSTVIETDLTNPVVIIVKDQNGDAFAGTEVSFATTDGTVSAATVTTDAIGNASVTWTLGTTIGIQTLNASVSGLTGSPVEFSATGEEKPLAVGDFAEGGVVFYIFVDGDAGYVNGEEHGLVCAVNDESTSQEWGCYATDITAIPNQTIPANAETEKVDGLAYSNAVVNECGENTAAGICRAKTTGKYNNWYLPTLRELKVIYDNRAVINATSIANSGEAWSESTSIPRGAYWSSTEYSNLNGWYYYFSYDNSSGYPKSATYRVRAVRAF